MPCTQNSRPGQRGFTLIEAVVSLSVVAIVSGILLVGAVPARRGAAVRNGAQQVAGFLREAAGLTVNGVKEPSCGTVDVCSQYRVSYDEDSAAYTREAVGGGTPATRALPAGTRFAASGFVTFRLAPPVLSVATAADPEPLPPGSKVPIPVAHVSGGTTWNVCVDGTGGIAVTAGAC